MGAGNRDPERFAEPDEVKLDREDNRHLAFGWASHFCFGAPLARMEGQIAFETLLDRFAEISPADESVELAPEPRPARPHRAQCRRRVSRPPP